MKEKTLLVILAHPDDESFAMGGTLAKYAAEGVRVVLVSATRGEAGIPGQPAAAVIRTRELQQAAATLGVSEVRFLDYRDGEVASVDPVEIQEKLGALMREIRPQAVITFGPEGISGHPDHVAIHTHVTHAFDAVQPGAYLYYIAPSEATLQGCGVVPTPQQAGGPVVAVDVAQHLLAKVRAMQCHISQHPPFAGPPEQEVAGMACHEYFTLVRPSVKQTSFADLFAVEPEVRAS